MLILGLSPTSHDATACLFDDYRPLAAVSEERLTRRKADGGRIPVAAIEECLAIAGVRHDQVDAVVTNRSLFAERYYRHFTGYRRAKAVLRRTLGIEKQKYFDVECHRYGSTDALAMFDAPRFLADHGFRPETNLSFCNHHLAHALPCLFHTDWPEALLYTADGIGDNTQYSIRLYRDGKLETLFGGDERLLARRKVDGLGEAYGMATAALGFIRNRHEGKLTGLAAYGKPVLYDVMAAHFRVDDSGLIESDFPDYAAMEQFIAAACKSVPREDAAASIQLLLENFILAAVRRILVLHPRRFLGLAGGVFANVRLNQRLAEELPVEEIFVFPAMGDQGQPYGGVLELLLRRDGMETWLANRRRMETLYYGRDFGAAIDERFTRDATFKQLSTTPVETAAKLLQQGRIVAIYSKAMEYGPRALGARSIMAAPVDNDINRTLNERLARSEFMPFAPVVMDKDADEVFDLGPAKRYAARFMTTTCRVHDRWRDRIPAVVHVDGTARPQVVERQQNPLYYDILAAYKARTGLPVLVNTSFNVHEEPIINSPDECARALSDRRIDFVVTDRGVYGLAG
jgi:carbamoyltransferase